VGLCCRFPTLYFVAKDGTPTFYRFTMAVEPILVFLRKNSAFKIPKFKKKQTVAETVAAAAVEATAAAVAAAGRVAETREEL